MPYIIPHRFPVVGWFAVAQLPPQLVGLTYRAGGTIATAQGERLLRDGIRQDFVVTNEIGRQVSPDWRRTLFGRFCKEHGFPITFHSLRHSAAVMMLSNVIDPKTVAGRLGHADTAMLWKTYAHFANAADKAAAATLESAWAKRG